jgi:putative FmdB family regulatory protein
LAVAGSECQPLTRTIRGQTALPTYQYRCTACDHAFEEFQSFTDDALTVCPVCSGRLRKVFNAVGVVFKGSGFYRTDSRAAGAGSKASSNGSGDSGSSDAGATTSTTGSKGSSDSSSGSKGSDSSGSSGSSGSSSSSTAGTSTG